MDGASAKICGQCKRPFTKSQIAERRRLKSERVKEALAMAKSLGEPVGRPRVADYDLIRKKREEGMSLGKIMKELGVTRGSVQNALRKPS